jgi:hypothetical protein
MKVTFRAQKGIFLPTIVVLSVCNAQAKGKKKDKMYLNIQEMKKGEDN